MTPKEQAERILELHKQDRLAPMLSHMNAQTALEAIYIAPQMAKRYLEAVELLYKCMGDIHSEFCGSRHWPLCEDLGKFLTEHEGELVE